MSSIQANDSDTSAFLTALTRISDQQKTICAQLDELLLLMQLPSESVLQVLRGLLLPMNSNIDVLVTTLQTRLGEA
ncbi:hypothetical protein H3H39_09245 [Duganella sp. LX47W]|uniref:Uncharacterized protein n=1 Tax=Rugamonas apoptosis TaxID=2758570 RepID=A0A7W2IKC4_9BURK|nr:hypothetical protein [Rugamonas apoptosis]